MDKISNIQDEIETVLFDSSEEELACDTTPVIALADLMLGWGIKKKITHLCIEHHKEKENILMRMRRDGIWHALNEPMIPKTLLPSLIARMKILAEVDITERQLPQAGMIRRDDDAGRKQAAFVCFLPTMDREEILIEYVSGAPAIAYADLKMPEAIDLCLQEACERKRGLILFAGPVGSGRMTTMFAITEQFLGRHRKVMVLERRASERLPFATHVQVDMGKYSNSFPMALPASLRHLPDAVLMSELKGQESCDRVIHAASGQSLIMARLTADSLHDALSCPLDAGVEPYLVASAVGMVIHQRLIRLLCRKCRQPASCADSPFAAKGCPDCQGTGYDGALAVFEAVVMEDRLREFLCRPERTRAQLREVLRQIRRGSLRQSALALARVGLTTLEEALRNTPADTA